MKIKFNQIKDLNDARYASSALSEWVGFTVNQLPISKVQEIIGWCAGPKLALELTTKELSEIAISWCTILPVNALECTMEDFSFWNTTLPHANQYEWILTSNNPSKFIEFQQNIPHPLVFHYQVNNIDNLLTTLEIWDQNHPMIINISTLYNQSISWSTMDLPGISINCEPETTLGEKNFETITNLFEELNIF